MTKRKHQEQQLHCSLGPQVHGCAVLLATPHRAEGIEVQGGEGVWGKMAEAEAHVAFSRDAGVGTAAWASMQPLLADLTMCIKRRLHPGPSIKLCCRQQLPQELVQEG